MLFLYTFSTVIQLAFHCEEFSVLYLKSLTALMLKQKGPYFFFQNFLYNSLSLPLAFIEETVHALSPFLCSFPTFTLLL